MCFHHMFREEAGPGVGLSRVQPLHVQTCPSRLTLAELAPLEPASAVLMRWPIASAACRMGSAERCEPLRRRRVAMPEQLAEDQQGIVGGGADARERVPEVMQPYA